MGNGEPGAEDYEARRRASSLRRPEAEARDASTLIKTRRGRLIALVAQVTYCDLQLLLQPSTPRCTLSSQHGTVRANSGHLQPTFNGKHDGSDGR